MNNKKWLAITIIIISLTFSPLIPISLSSTTNLYVEPTSTTATIGQNFSINISITEVTDLCGWEIKLHFKNDILNTTDCEEGPFLQSAGSTEFHSQITNNYNETHGRVRMLCMLNDFTNGGVDGSGVLGSITFNATDAGTSPLTLKDTKLRNRNIEPITHTTTDGTVEVTSTITITNITPFTTIAAQGIPFPINVTTLNEGDQPATFDLTIYYNSTPIETKQITQPKQTNLTTTFMWDTTELTRYQNYTISASTIHGTFIDGTITLVIPGDLDADKDVDLYDAVKLLKVYGTKVDNPNYDPNCDIDCDGSIILYDAVILLIHYGHQEP